ncbi:glycoside hydrolase family 71 protein [Rhodococcus sp. MEB064]|uniref:glycoside hydrolase family 71 protein n=1 Tax=Rhodococcus sp. MEB064 TaxID=1587522 RepID=UPI0018CD8AB2|nr:glycoside hydrolase family 71 protein [Rhodococcus sp. MEB064]
MNTAYASPGIPVDIPTTPSAKKVFAHYFPPYPVSLDNVTPASDYYATQYLDPNGENGKHAAYGGFLRDRPIPRAPRAGTDWKIQDLRQEVADARSRGIDGFTVDILTRSSSSNPIAPVARQLIDVAGETRGAFSVVLMPDMNGELGGLTPDGMADELQQYAKLPGTYRLADGRLVVSPFYAERKPASWWSSFMTSMKNRYGITVAFVPTFLDAPSNIDAFASISYGMSNWGGRNPAFNPTTNTNPYSPVAIANRVHSLGKIWMQPVSFQDSRPNQSIYDEAQNTTNLRNTWDIAISTNSEWIQLTTWNDYSEGATFAPSVRHAWGPLDVSAYYLVRYKYGSWPAIKRIGLFISHRTQTAAARPSFPESRLMTLRQGSSPARDLVEVATFVSSPAQVTVQVGTRSTTCSVPAGLGICTAPLGTGTIRAVIKRNGLTVQSVTSAQTVAATPYVQSLDYTMTSSRK